MRSLVVFLVDTLHFLGSGLFIRSAIVGASAPIMGEADDGAYCIGRLFLSVRGGSTSTSYEEFG